MKLFDMCSDAQTDLELAMGFGLWGRSGRRPSPGRWGMIDESMDWLRDNLQENHFPKNCPSNQSIELNNNNHFSLESFQVKRSDIFGARRVRV